MLLAGSIATESLNGSPNHPEESVKSPKSVGLGMLLRSVSVKLLKSVSLVSIIRPVSKVT